MSEIEAQDDLAQWYGPDVATFGDRLAAARENAVMSQSQFAKRIGVRKATAVSWEEDVAEPRANKLTMISGILGVSIKWLLTGEGEEIDAPDAATPSADADTLALLTEIRDIRAQMKAASDRLSLLEKRLRKQVNG